MRGWQKRAKMDYLQFKMNDDKSTKELQSISQRVKEK